MTKPEGPAQEPPCAECGVPRELHDDPKQYIAPATPAPSQPAAREWFIELGYAGDKRVPFLTHDGRDGIRLDTEAEQYIRGLMDARQQTAAKDAEIRELTFVKDVWVETGENYKTLLELAERERDSLREDNDEAYRQLGLEDYEGEDGLAHHIAILQAQLAALKAGKDGQK
jgi:hypothetical protein